MSSKLDTSAAVVKDSSQSPSHAKTSLLVTCPTAMSLSFTGQVAYTVHNDESSPGASSGHLNRRSLKTGIRLKNKILFY